MKEKLDKIYTKFKELRKEAAEDCDFDKLHMETQFNNTFTISKWINKKVEYSEVYRIYDFKRKQKYKTLFEFYKLESNLKLDNKNELALFIESDINYNDLLHICQVLKEILEYIQAIIDNLKNKNWEISRYIDYQKFIHGK